MWHRLSPRTCGHYLCPPEVVRRLKREFAYVETSDEDGQRLVLEIIQQLVALRHAGAACIDAKYLAHLEQVQERAIVVHFGDDLTSDASLLSVPVVPEEPLIVEYASPGHQQSLRPLVARCAAVLEYDMVEE